MLEEELIMTARSFQTEFIMNARPFLTAQRAVPDYIQQTQTEKMQSATEMVVAL